jgi:hypothetical protein
VALVPHELGTANRAYKMPHITDNTGIGRMNRVRIKLNNYVVT